MCVCVCVAELAVLHVCVRACVRVCGWVGGPKDSACVCKYIESSKVDWLSYGLVICCFSTRRVFIYKQADLYSALVMYIYSANVIYKCSCDLYITLTINIVPF